MSSKVSLMTSASTLGYQDLLYLVQSGTSKSMNVRLLGRMFGTLNVRAYGAVGDGTTDDSAAFTAALADLATLATSGYGYGGTASPKLFVPAGVYWLNTTTLDLTAGIVIHGESPGLLAPGASVLKWADNTTGIRLQETNTTGATGVLGTPRSSSGRSTIKNLTLWGAYGSTEYEAYGIHARTNVCIEDVAIYNFSGDGVRILATAGGGAGTEGNANAWFCQRVFVQNCRVGIFVDGADVNAGNAIGCYAINCRRWGFWDSSFLGNTWNGCSVDTSGLVPGSIPTVVTASGNRYGVIKDQGAGASTNAPSGTTADNAYWYYIGAGGANSLLNIAAWSSGTTYRDGGSFRGDGEGNAGSVFNGCYHEGGQGFAQIDSPAVVIGNSMLVRGVPVLKTSGSNLYSTANISAAGNLSGAGSAHQFGPQGGSAVDVTVNLNTTNSFTGFWGTFYTSLGAPTTIGTLLFSYGNGILYNVANTGWSHKFRINGSDLFYVAASGAGYPDGLGVGGAVTQATSRTTGVTLNKVSGAITLFSAAGSATWNTFTVTNSNVAATDTVRVCQKSGTDKYQIHVTKVQAGSFDVTFATTGGTTTEQPVFNFSIMKGASS